MNSFSIFNGANIIRVHDTQKGNVVRNICDSVVNINQQRNCIRNHGIASLENDAAAITNQDHVQ